MVVPIERVTKPENRKQYVGNNLKIDIRNNSSTLLVTGNNCRISLDENSGHVKVIGDKCEIEIRKGGGDIVYIGNYGKINLGAEVADETVNYVGKGGEIISASKSSTNLPKCEQKTNIGEQNAEPCVNISVQDVDELHCEYSNGNFSLRLPSIHISRRTRTKSTKKN